jgi:hypothetical protein
MDIFGEINLKRDTVVDKETFHAFGASAASPGF